MYDARTVLPEFRWGLTFGRDSIPCLGDADVLATELNDARAAHALPLATVVQIDESPDHLEPTRRARLRVRALAKQVLAAGRLGFHVGSTASSLPSSDSWK